MTDLAILRLLAAMCAGALLSGALWLVAPKLPFWRHVAAMVALAVAIMLLVVSKP